jgi:hypothetical protein
MSLSLAGNAVSNQQALAILAKTAILLLLIARRAATDQTKKMGARRFELRTSSLSGTRSNQLSYAPA